MRLALAVVLAAAAACGYRPLTGPALLGATRVHVGPFQEEGEDSGLAARVQAGLASALAQEGLVMTAAEADAQRVFVGRVTRLAMQPGVASFGAESSPSHALRARAQVELRGPDGGRLWGSGAIDVQDTLLAGSGLGASELDILATEANRRRALDGLSQRIVAETLRRLRLAALQPPPSAP